jgi:hypothetical protein
MVCFICSRPAGSHRATHASAAGAARAAARRLASNFKQPGAGPAADPRTRQGRDHPHDGSDARHGGAATFPDAMTRTILTESGPARPGLAP